MSKIVFDEDYELSRAGSCKSSHNSLKRQDNEKFATNFVFVKSFHETDREHKLPLQSSLSFV